MLDWIPSTSDDVGPTAKVVGRRLAASGGVASSGHPVDGSASVVLASGLCSSVYPRGSSYHTAWASVMCADSARLVYKKTVAVFWYIVLFVFGKVTFFVFLDMLNLNK